MLVIVMNELNDKKEFDWSPLGESWWRYKHRATKATAQQTKFACARYRGCSATEAARQSGYSGGTDNEHIRTSASRALRSKSVENLLVLAAAEGSPRRALVSDDEVHQKLSDMINSGDPATALRATEQRAKMKAHEAERGRGEEWDGLSQERWVRDLLLVPNHVNRADVAAGILLLMGCGLRNAPLFHDVVPMVKEEWPEVFNKLYAKGNDSNRAEIDSHLADRTYQLYGRQLLWGEMGFIVDGDGKVRPDPQGRRVIHPTVSMPTWDNDNTSGSAAPEAANANGSAAHMEATSYPRYFSFTTTTFEEARLGATRLALPSFRKLSGLVSGPLRAKSRMTVTFNSLAN